MPLCTESSQQLTEGSRAQTLKRRGWKSPSEVPSSEPVSCIYTRVNRVWEQGQDSLSDLTMGPGTCSCLRTQQHQVLVCFILYVAPLHLRMCPASSVREVLCVVPQPAL